jgi:hypothetical protein
MSTSKKIFVFMANIFSNINILHTQSIKLNYLNRVSLNI